MPPLPDVFEVFRIQLIQDAGNDTKVGSRFYMGVTGSSSPSPAQLATFSAAVEAAWATHIAPLVYVEQALTSVITTDLDSGGNEGEWTGTTAGTRSGAALPIGVATLINFAIARRYRGGKPRMYMLAGVDGDLTNASEWTATYVAAVVAGWNAFITAISGVTVGPRTTTDQVSVSYYSGFTAIENTRTGRWRNAPNVRTGSIPVDAVTGVSVPRAFSSQRRRNRVGV